MCSKRRLKGWKWIHYLKLPCYVLIIALAGGCTKVKVYKHQQWKALKAQHKTMAILPFKVSYTYDQKPKRLSDAQIEELEQNQAAKLREELYTSLLDQDVPGKGISFQALAAEDSLMNKMDQDTSNRVQPVATELAQFSNADALFSLNTSTHFYRSETEALAIMILSIFSVATKQISSEATIHDRRTGELVWKYTIRFKGGLTDSERRIRKKLGRKITRQFPYK